MNNQAPVPAMSPLEEWVALQQQRVYLIGTLIQGLGSGVSASEKTLIRSTCATMCDKLKESLSPTTRMSN